MITSISAGQLIYEQLIKSEKLKAKVGDNIFPIIAEENASLPCVIFAKSTTDIMYTKDLLAYDIVQYSITVIAKNYFETCSILEIIREIFENYRSNQIYSMKVDSIVEDYIDGAYVHNIIFNTQIKPIEN